MTPAEARAYLEALHPSQIALGLDRMIQVMARLGHPERCAPVLHVAGTNGKGSVCAMAERAMRASGRRTGFYSSPHLLRFEERIRIDGEPMSDALLVDAVERVRAAGEGLDLTYFEFGTAMAFAAFQKAKVDVQVLETGLGGRLDATNITTPVATAITTLGLDHTKILGETLAQIAFEKAGILKPGVGCAVATPLPEAREVLERRAREVGTTLWIEGRDFALEGSTYRGPTAALTDVTLGLRGPHQRHNAAVALALLEIASATLPLPDEARRKGLAEARWPGRLQVAVPRGAARGVEVALDGAHNPQAAQALADAVRALWPNREVTLVFGVLDDKDLTPMLRTLLPLADRALLTTPASPRARPAASYADEARALLPAIAIEERAQDAFTLAVAETSPGGLVLVCGSLYLVAEGLRWLQAP